MNSTPSTVPLSASILSAMAEALVYADREGVIREWNAASESLFGFSREEALGQSLDLIIPERLREAHWRGFDKAMASGATRLGGKPTLTRALTRGGEAIYVEMSFAVVADAEGRPIGSAAVARDATQRRAESLELRELRERVAALPGSGGAA